MEARIEALEARCTEEGRVIDQKIRDRRVTRPRAGRGGRRSSCGCSTPVSDPAPAVLVRNRQTTPRGRRTLEITLPSMPQKLGADLRSIQAAIKAPETSASRARVFYLWTGNILFMDGKYSGHFHPGPRLQSPKARVTGARWCSQIGQTPETGSLETACTTTQSCGVAPPNHGPLEVPGFCGFWAIDDRVETGLRRRRVRFRAEVSAGLSWRANHGAPWPGG